MAAQLLLFFAVFVVLSVLSCGNALGSACCGRLLRSLLLLLDFFFQSMQGGLILLFFQRVRLRVHAILRQGAGQFRGQGQPKGLREVLLAQVVDLKHVFVAHERDTPDVRQKCLLRQVLDSGVTGKHRVQFLLNGMHLAMLRRDAFDGNAGRFQLLHEGLFGGREEKHGVATALVTRSTANAMDVGIHSVGAIHLHHPIDRREVDAPRGDIGAEQRNRPLAFAEFLENNHPLGEALPPMQFHHRGTRLQLPKGLVEETDLLARGDEDNRLLLRVRPEERKEGVDLLLKWHDHVHLLEPIGSSTRRVLVHAHHLRRAQSGTTEAVHACVQRCRKKHRLPISRQMREDVVHGLLETEIQDAVCFVEHEHLQIGGVESRRLVEVLQKPARRSDQDVHRRHSLLLLVNVASADDATRRKFVLFAHGCKDLENLVCQLSCRRHNQGTEAIHLRPAAPEKAFDKRHEEREGLAGARPRLPKHVPATKCVRNRAALNLGHLRVLRRLEPGQRPPRDRQLLEKTSGERWSRVVTIAAAAQIYACGT
mmetsp:Transcript_35466/g.97976  ORF Transcript_35466/g.97976 Transcript_35466/m.97976 type:complete len:538 (-) Transcript_35466:320-1933(-)